jgi:hypothetical protein
LKKKEQPTVPLL